MTWNDLCTDGDDLLWYRHVPLFHECRWFIRNEPERSQRVARIAFRNWITWSAQPASLWPTRAIWQPIENGGIPLLLLNDARALSAPSSVKGLTAAELNDWYQSTLLFRRVFNNNLCRKLASLRTFMLEARVDHARLIDSVAEALSERERGDRGKGG